MQQAQAQSSLPPLLKVSKCAVNLGALLDVASLAPTMESVAAVARGLREPESPRRVGSRGDAVRPESLLIARRHLAH
jgi:hypothetical protein